MIGVDCVNELGIDVMYNKNDAMPSYDATHRVMMISSFPCPNACARTCLLHENERKTKQIVSLNHTQIGHC